MYFCMYVSARRRHRSHVSIGAALLWKHSTHSKHTPLITPPSVRTEPDARLSSSCCRLGHAKLMLPCGSRPLAPPAGEVCHSSVGPLSNFLYEWHVLLEPTGRILRVHDRLRHQKRVQKIKFQVGKSEGVNNPEFAIQYGRSFYQPWLKMAFFAVFQPPGLSVCRTHAVVIVYLSTCGSFTHKLSRSVLFYADMS